MMPTVRVEVPSTVMRYTGKSAWIISDETSINIETKRKIQMLVGTLARPLTPPETSLSFLFCIRAPEAPGEHRLCRKGRRKISFSVDRDQFAYRCPALL